MQRDLDMQKSLKVWTLVCVKCAWLPAEWRWAPPGRPARPQRFQTTWETGSAVSSASPPIETTSGGTWSSIWDSLLRESGWPGTWVTLIWWPLSQGCSQRMELLCIQTFQRQPTVCDHKILPEWQLKLTPSPCLNPPPLPPHPPVSAEMLPLHGSVCSSQLSAEDGPCPCPEE